jgi:hypothetical protein
MSVSGKSSYTGVRRTRDECEQRIFDALAERGPLMTQQIADATGFSKGMTRGLLGHMHAIGWVSRGKNWRWEAVDGA